MEKKAEKKPDFDAVRKQLEAATGKKIDVPDDLILHFRWPVSAYTFTEGDVLWRNILFPPGKSCVDSTLLDLSATGWTDASGSVTFLLSSYYCDALDLAAPVNLEATVRGTSPAFPTVTYTLVQPPNSSYYNDLSITVYTWDANGKPAPNVEFDWRCRVVSIPIIQ
jgi:hypothetical protein